MSIPRAKSQTRRKQPAYALIKSALAKHIRAGDVPPGTVLSESAIATLFGLEALGAHVLEVVHIGADHT